MRSKIISTINSTRKRQRNHGAKQRNISVNEILNEEVVTLTTQQQTISSSSSHATNQTNITTDANETSSRDQSADQTQEKSDAPPTKSEVWDYATKLSNNKAKCHNCNREISCQDHSTSGLRRHLRRCANVLKFAPVSHPSRNGINRDVKKKLNELVYRCIIEDGRSFGDLRKPGMAHLLHGILPGNGEQIASRKK